MLTRQSWEEDNQKRFFVRFLYDMTCFIVINVIFTNLIFGIIIDAFGVLRDKNKSRIENMENICFICSLDRFKLEKEGKGFMYHIRESHYVWNYLFYIYYLKSKDSTEFNGIESYVSDKLKHEDINWFPIKRCLDIDPGTNENNTLEK